MPWQARGRGEISGRPPGTANDGPRQAAGPRFLKLFCALALGLAVLAASPLAAQQASVIAKPAPPPPAVPGHLDLLRGFDAGPLYADKEQKTLGSGSGATVTGIVVKWAQPIVYRFEGPATDAQREAARDALARLAGLAGLTLRPAQPGGGDANYTIRFREVPLARAAEEKANCLSAWGEDRYTGRMQRATLDVNTAPGIDPARCLVHETLHTLGIRGHAHDLHSVMSYRTAGRVNDLTEADRLLLAVLYDPRLTVGMGRLPALVLADKLIEEKRRALNPAAPPRAAPDPVLRAARAELEAAAKGGSMAAMLQLTEAYREGHGVARDMAAAQAWLAKAEAVSDPARRVDLAVAYAYGSFVPKDMAKAAEHYRWCAERGLAAAQIHIGRLLQAGDGVAADPVAAMTWYLIAARSGNRLAQQHRDALARGLTPIQREAAEARAKAWTPTK